MPTPLPVSLLSSECGTHTTVKAIFWRWLSGKGPYCFHPQTRTRGVRGVHKDQGQPRLLDGRQPALSLALSLACSLLLALSLSLALSHSHNHHPALRGSCVCVGVIDTHSLTLTLTLTLTHTHSLSLALSHSSTIATPCPGSFSDTNIRNQMLSDCWRALSARRQV